MSLHRKFEIGWREELTCQSGVYLRRWRIEIPILSIRVHHWLHSDDSRAHHDHPWSFLSFIFWGGYTDHGLEDESQHWAPSLVYRAAQHKHWVEVGPKGCWSVLVTGPKIRRWGFWIREKFVVSYRYFYRYGSHPCD